MRHGEQHLHKRHAKIDEETLSKNRRIKILDRICMVFSVVMPATAIPQIYKIYNYKDASGVSLLMWILYCVAVIPWLLYGIVHKSKPIILLNTLWMIAQVIIIIGILMYG